MAFRDITAPYARWESGLYDRLIAHRITAALEDILEAGGFSFLLSATEPLRVLDVGCGGGQNALLLKERSPALRITGVDLSADQVRRAKARDPRGSATFLEGDALRLPFPDRSFDAVVSFGCMKHWPDMAQGLRECLRVLEPQGRLMVMDSLGDASSAEVRAFFRLLRLPLFAYPFFRLFFDNVVVRHSPSFARVEGIVRDLPDPRPGLVRAKDFPGFLIRR